MWVALARQHLPGASVRCAVAHVFLLVRHQPDWTKRYAPWSEIQQYILKVTEQYGLRPYIQFGQEVVSAVFNEANGRWVIKTASGDTLMARHWVLASGPRMCPPFPISRGLKDFQGKVMHSAQWDHNTTSPADGGVDRHGRQRHSVRAGNRP